jgi:hypothetical protein
MNRDVFLARARSAIGKRIIYKLGGGGMRPEAPLPSNANGECDCSGFVCWALGLSRQTAHPLYMNFNGGWINTDGIVRDARRETGFFFQPEAPSPGDLIVFPSMLPTRKVGHVGIITEVAQQDGSFVPTRVLHCSHGNFKVAQDAIAETGPAVFVNNGAIYARYEGLA